MKTITPDYFSTNSIKLLQILNICVGIILLAMAAYSASSKENLQYVFLVFIGIMSIIAGLTHSQTFAYVINFILGLIFIFGFTAYTLIMSTDTFLWFIPELLELSRLDMIIGLCLGVLYIFEGFKLRQRGDLWKT